MPIPDVHKLSPAPVASLEQQGRLKYTNGNWDLYIKALELTSPSQSMGTSAGSLTQLKLP